MFPDLLKRHVGKTSQVSNAVFQSCIHSNKHIHQNSSNIHSFVLESTFIRVSIKIPPIINNCEPFASSQQCDVGVGVDIADDLIKELDFLDIVDELVNDLWSRSLLSARLY